MLGFYKLLISSFLGRWILCILDDFYLCNRLNGPEIESHWRRDSPLRCRSDRCWGPPHLMYHGHYVCIAGVKRPGRGVGKLHTPRLKKEYYCTSTPLWAFMACYRVELLSFTTVLVIFFVKISCLLFVILIRVSNILSYALEWWWRHTVSTIEPALSRLWIKFITDDEVVSFLLYLVFGRCDRNGLFWLTTGNNSGIWQTVMKLRFPYLLRAPSWFRLANQNVRNSK